MRNRSIWPLMAMGLASNPNIFPIKKNKSITKRTKFDIERIEKAKLKRERKKAKRLKYSRKF